MLVKHPKGFSTDSVRHCDDRDRLIEWRGIVENSLSEMKIEAAKLQSLHKAGDGVPFHSYTNLQVRIKEYGVLIRAIQTRLTVLNKVEKLNNKPLSEYIADIARATLPERMFQEILESAQRRKNIDTNRAMGYEELERSGQ